MLDDLIRPYRLKVQELDQIVTALCGDTVVAQSGRARMMHETRLPPAIYFPRNDVIGLSPDATDRRTFCPFKGTAIYHDLTIGGERFENAAWSYPKALPDSSGVEGMIGFMPGIVDRYEATRGLPPRTSDGNVSGPVIDWLLREAWLAPDPAALTREIALNFCRQGIAVSRLHVVIWSLHPLFAGVMYLWSKGCDEVQIREARHENLASEAYRNSPIRHVSDGLGGVRQSLTTDHAEFDFPIMEELCAEGATDYVAMPLPFSDGQMNVMSMACDHPEGFTTANLGLVFECLTTISRHYEVHSQRANARTLLSTFLGRRTGKRVLGGEIRRGDGEEIEAAVLFCDLRDSSRMSGSMARQDYLALLNRFFDAVGGAVEAEQGEILKFIGDAVLAIFPADGGAGAACDRAIRAARAIEQRLAAMPSPENSDAIRAAMGISFGLVTWGNVGSEDRLDFTVIGDAANIAARLSDLAKNLGTSVLVCSEICDRTSAECTSKGIHELHNIVDPVAVHSV